MSGLKLVGRVLVLKGDLRNGQGHTASAGDTVFCLGHDLETNRLWLQKLNGNEIHYFTSVARELVNEPK